MNTSHGLQSPGSRAVVAGILAGVLVRLSIFTNNFYYPDIGMPYTLALPSAAVLIVGVLIYLFAR